MKALRFVVVLALVQGLAGCSEPPSAPTRPIETPVPLVGAPAPSVSTISPNLGSTGGSTPVTIKGSGFQRGATVSFDGRPSSWSPWVQDGTTIAAWAPANGAGAVDVVVRNPDGKTASLTGGYTYVSPDTFDPNGTWEGAAGPEGWEYALRFTVQDDVVSSVSCGTSGVVTFSPPPLVSNGEFRFSGSEGTSMSGQILAATMARGTINLPSCSATGWFATKREGHR